MLLLICLLSVVQLAFGSENVLSVTDGTFEKELSGIDVALVEFYAPWCGHCKALEPKWNEAANKIAEDPKLSGVRLVKIDADAEKRIPGKFGVSGFPTIKLFRFGEFAEDFEGDRSVEGIVNFVSKKAEMAINKEVESIEELKKLTSPKLCSNPVAVVGFFSDKQSVDYKIFSSVATQLASSGLSIYHASKHHILETVGYFGTAGSVQIYRCGVKPFKVTYKGTIFAQKLKDWILSNALPKAGLVFNSNTEALFKSSGASVVRILTGVAKANEAKEMGNVLSKKFPELYFAFGDVTEYAADVTAHCGKGASTCALATEGAKKGKMRTFGTPNIDEDNVSKFVSDFVAGVLKVKVKSEVAPASPPKAGVVNTLVGTNFEQVVGESSKGVFIKFYAPWCGHCKALAPTLDEVAKDLVSEFDDVIVAKFDSTANDLPTEFQSSYPVSGFPTLYFAPKGKPLSPVKYEGGRDASSLKEFILKQIQ